MDINGQYGDDALLSVKINTNMHSISTNMHNIRSYISESSICVVAKISLRDTVLTYTSL